MQTWQSCNYVVKRRQRAIGTAIEKAKGKEDTLSQTQATIFASLYPLVQTEFDIRSALTLKSKARKGTDLSDADRSVLEKLPENLKKQASQRCYSLP